jgi:hypothetical protein
MTVQDLRIGILNAITFGVSFTHIENSLKIILLLLSIGYTALKTLNKASLTANADAKCPKMF